MWCAEETLCRHNGTNQRLLHGCVSGTGKDKNDAENTFRVTCTYDWKRVSLVNVVKITSDVINLSGDVGETVEGSFDVEQT